MGILDKDRIVIIFSDVCGHGMSAAFITAVIKTTFQDWLDKPDTLSGLGASLNKNLFRLTPTDSFAAVFLAVYDHSRGSCRYINFGHNPEPWLIPWEMKKPVQALSNSRSLVLGFVEEVESTEAELHLDPGDNLIFVSDGVIENCDPEGDLYGTGWFENILKKNRLLPPEELITEIKRESIDCIGLAGQLDDCTVLTFRIKITN